MSYGAIGGKNPQLYSYAPKISSFQLNTPTLETDLAASSQNAGPSFSANFWHSGSDFSNQHMEIASTKDHTGIEQASQAFRDKVAQRLADGIGAQIIEGDKSVLPDLKMLVTQKMSLASNLGFQKNVSGQVKMLLSAFSDVEWFVGTILFNFNGVELPGPAKDIIASLRAMQSTIMGQVKSATGLNLSDAELRALLEQDPAKAGQNMNLNWLVQQDHELTPKQNQPENIGPAKQNQIDNPGEEVIYGIQSNPRKYQNRLKSGGTKIVNELQKIMQQIQSLMGGNHKNPQANAANILPLLDRGAAICMVAMACEDLQPGSSGNAPQLKGTFEQFNQNVMASLQMGLPKMQSIT